MHGPLNVKFYSFIHTDVIC